ncbi:hypothetical protein PDIP_87030 [Penicillium digitatum Pd1]|uniref:Uncharacterized protein n=1 Tax=Penicillium digitatum (strain Pd1 / CECT 20795) TaxID=1170230 RepID=K9F609_PEND1|nr:hypothetical protein PDIP_87030 [Penicillium digitatum Pd1]EKV04479.1 hypothetical protein PDIP_87030 [Penicillium digitatum Pd1]
MLSKCKHRCAVSRVFDDNLTVFAGRLTICGYPKAVELIDLNERKKTTSPFL